MAPSFDWDTFYTTSLVTAGVTDDDLPCDPDEPGPDQRWSTWPETAHTLDRGPQPFPAWVVQHEGAIDTELGVLKTGKEADAFLLERALPPDLRTGATGEAILMVAKRYRTDEHTSFHRSAQYTEGRRVTDSREGRAIARGSAFGKRAAAGQWARAEFDTLSRLHAAGLAVPYPVQIQGTEVCMEFIGVGGAPGEHVTPVAGPRLHEHRPSAERAAQWAQELHGFVLRLAELGLVHGDLSAYNVLVDPRSDKERLVVIDVPQVIDLIANPNGPDFLRRDCENVCTWLRAHGADPRDADAESWWTEAMARRG
ncbi:serine protein kinase RIO [Brachybacterium kimchii]|uniref:non-specific serine/threonine protein kinase n=1 Tax=Brachybacterium kimchii TaxID=2942909 RepID=A0ABY4N6F8_9MICO|nr:RIO1 family regulatory kinase/ATPase [Brachybacterium kimchii]UQN29377.1 serine/threonine protein kinase [Brachybacterium kimchii]